MLFSQRTPHEHPPTPPPSRWLALITLPYLAKFQLVWCHLYDCAVCLLPLRAQPYDRLYNTSISLVANTMCFRTPSKCSRFLPDLYLMKSEWNSTARMPRLVVSPPSFSPSHPPPPPTSRWPALITLPPLAKFQLVWRRLCEALLCSSLACQKHPSLLSRLCLTYVGDIKFVLP